MLAHLPFLGDSRPARDSVLPGAVTGRDVLVMGSYRKPDLQENTTGPMHGHACQVMVIRVSPLLAITNATLAAVPFDLCWHAW